MKRRSGGYALTIAIIFMTMLMLLSSFTLNFAYNRKRLSDDVGPKQMAATYRAKAGVIDAEARIRNNYLTGPGASSFTTPSFNPSPYHLDLDLNPTNPLFISTAATRPDGYDVTVDIGPVAGGVRAIESTGSDVL